MWGAALALAHPLTVLSAFLAAPITTLHPLLAAGWIAGIVQAFVKRPTVSDLENLPEAIGTHPGLLDQSLLRASSRLSCCPKIRALIGVFVAGPWIAARSVDAFGHAGIAGAPRLPDRHWTESVRPDGVALVALEHELCRASRTWRTQYRDRQSRPDGPGIRSVSLPPSEILRLCIAQAMILPVYIALQAALRATAMRPPCAATG